MDELAICAIMRNEARYIQEWLGYHYAVGVRRFVLYDNGSDDGSREAVQAWPRRDLVTVVDWPQRDAPQLRAYADMATRFRLLAEWCAFIDCDEFLVPQSCVALLDVLRAIGREANGLYVHWYMFGSSGHLTRQPGLVTETFLWRAPDAFGSHFYGKSIVRLGALTHVGLHVFRVSGRIVNDSGWEVDQQSAGVQQRKSHRLLALNHYFTKSRAEWVERRARGKADKTEDDPEFRRPDAEFAAHDLNAVEDSRARLFMQAARAMFYLPARQAEVVMLPSPAVLLSAHGTLLCWDAAAGRVVHRAPERIGQGTGLLVAAVDEGNPPRCRLPHALDGADAFALALVEGGPLVSLGGERGHVRATADTDALDAAADQVREWEMFLPLAPDDAARILTLRQAGVQLQPGFALLVDEDRYDLRWSIPRRRLAAIILPPPPPETAAPSPAPPPAVPATALPLYDLAAPATATLDPVVPIGPALAALRGSRRAATIATLSPPQRLARAAPFYAAPLHAAPSGDPAAPFAALFQESGYRSYAVDGVTCSALADASLFSPDGLVWFGGAILPDSAGSLEAWRPDSWVAEPVPAGAPNLRLRRAATLPPPTQTVPIQTGPFFCGFVGAWRNYAHWMTECLPRLFAFCRLRQATPSLRLVLPPLDPGSVQAQTVATLGITPAQVVTLQPGAVLTGTMWTTDAIDVWAPPGLCREAADALGDAADGPHDGLGARLYIRRGADTRRMLDLPGLQTLLDQHGFHVVTMQALSLVDQVRTMRAARWVVGECGAALANIMFCEPGARVLELFNEAWAHPAHWSLASLCGHDYGFLEGRHVPSPAHPQPAHNADYVVTPAMLEPALAALLAA